jgi:hypothetical protein
MLKDTWAKIEKKGNTCILKIQELTPNTNE